MMKVPQATLSAAPPKDSQRSRTSRQFSAFIKSDRTWLRLSECGFKWSMCDLSRHQRVWSRSHDHTHALDPYYFTFAISCSAPFEEATAFCIYMVAHEDPEHNDDDETNAAGQCGFQNIDVSLRFMDCTMKTLGEENIERLDSIDTQGHMV